MTDTIYNSYNPVLTGGRFTMTFNSTPRVNIVPGSLNVSKSRDVAQYKIPAQEGVKILGSTRNGQVIDLELEIATDDPEAITTKILMLQDIFDGGDDGKFTFFLNYIDSQNYFAYTNCVCPEFSTADALKDTKDPDYYNRVSLQFISEDSEPTIIANGIILAGDPTTISTTPNVIGSTTIIISDEFIVQNSHGKIIARISAPTGKFSIIGTIEQTL